MKTSLVLLTLAGTILCQRIGPVGPWSPQPSPGGWPGIPGGPGGHHGGFGGRGGGGRGPYPHGVPLPPFAQNLLPHQQEEFLRIVTDMNLSISDQKRKVGEWAARHGVQAQLNDFNNKIDNLKNVVKQNVTQLIAQLAEAQKKLFALLENEQQTPKQLFDAIRNLTQQNPPLYHVLMFANDQIMMELHRTRGGPRVPGGPPRPVGPIGPGAPMPPYVAPGQPGFGPGGGMWRPGWGHPGNGGMGGHGNMGGYGGRGPFPF